MSQTEFKRLTASALPPDGKGFKGTNNVYFTDKRALSYSTVFLINSNIQYHNPGSSETGSDRRNYKPYNQ